MKEFEEQKKGSKAKKFFILAILTAIGTAVATLWNKKKNEELMPEKETKKRK